MKLSGKIIILWVSILIVYFSSLAIFPSYPTPISAHLNQIIQSLLFVISLFIISKEPNKKNKFVFVNFSIYFSLAFFSLLYDFIGKDFIVLKYSRALYYQYISILYIFAQSFAVIYLVIDLLFRDFKITQKYLATLLIAVISFGFFFHSFFVNPLHLYSTEDIKQWKTLDTYVANLKEIPSPVELANKVTLQSWKDGHAIGDLYQEDNLKRIETLFPYLEKNSENWMVLLWKPLYLNIITLDLLIILFILLFFGYQYKKDPPQGAYIDKIMFLVLLLSSMDILHNWGFIKSVEWGSFSELFSVGQYITVFAELMMVLFFSLRLRFITSVQGEFYETELIMHPHQVSRWRDWVDNFVLAQFFNYKIFNGRLFQDPSGK